MATIVVNQDGSITVTPTARERIVLERSAASEEQEYPVFIDRVVNRAINEWQRFWREKDALDRQSAYDAATNNVKSQIDVLLGLD